MRTWVKIVLLIAALLAVFSFFRDPLIKTVVVAAARNAAGVEVSIDGFSMSLPGQSAHLSGIKVFNPPGFPGETVMLDIPEAAVTLDVPALLWHNTLHVPFLGIDLKEARVVTDRQRHKNVEALNFARPQPSQGSSAAGPASAAGKPPMKMLFDRVVLSVGRVTLDDYSSGKALPRRTVITLNMKNKELRNITGPSDLGMAVMRETLESTGLDSLFSAGKGAANSVTAGIFKSFSDILK